jgi:hypothetical protein
MLFMDIPRLKVAHDTPPLRGFGLLVSRVLQLRVSRPRKEDFAFAAIEAA